MDRFEQPFSSYLEQQDTSLLARNIACDLKIPLEKEIAHELRAFKILEELKNKNLLEKEVARVKNKFKEELKSLDKDFTEECWEMLTVLELFDEETALHCVNTFLIAKSKVEKTLWNGIILANEFKKEEVSLPQFYRACVLHDIGKIEVPHSVLINQVTDLKCARLLFENQENILTPLLKDRFGDRHTQGITFNNEEELLEYIYNELHTRPQTLTPVKVLLDAPITEEIISQLAHCGCSIEDSLLKIMQTHDEYSNTILKRLGLNIEGELAGSHHINKNKETSHQITVGTMQVTINLADIVHLADVENAIVSKRHYKTEKTSLDALKILAMHSKQGLIGGEGYVAYIWIADEINKIQEDLRNEEEIKTYNFITNFLNEEKNKHEFWPSWKRGGTLQ